MMGIQAQFHLVRDGFELDISLHLPNQGVSALFGPSGSGKTTCLRAMAGLERLPNSRFVVAGQVWQDESQGIFIPPHQREIGYVFQEASLFPHLTVQQNLCFGYQRIPIHQRQLSQDSVISLLGIGHLLKRHPAALSGGERQRVAIARALLTSPKLLLMDEPLSALDLALKQEILPYLVELHQSLSIPVIYVSHSTDEVARLADHISLLHQGRVLASGPLDQVLLDHRFSLLFPDGASTLLSGRISEQFDQEYLTLVDIAGLTLRLSQRPYPVGSALRCRIYASDVSLSLSQPQDSSILNVFAGKVLHISPAKHPGEVLVTVALLNDQRLLAQISSHSLQKLQIQLGTTLWAQVKSVAVL